MGSPVRSEPRVEVLPGPPSAAVRAVRQEVFVDEQGVPAALEHDDADATADHAVVRDDTGRVIATARLLDPESTPGVDLGPRPGPGPDRGPEAGDAGPGHPGVAAVGTAGGIGSAGGAGGTDGVGAVDEADEACGIIGRVAVRREARGLGVGRAVTRALERRALVRGLAEIRLHAQLAVEHFYVGLGYRSVGGPHPTAGIEHVWMTRSLIPGLRRVRDADGPALERLIGGIWAEYPGCVLDVDREEPWLRAPASAYGDRSGPPSAGSGDDHGHRAYRGAMWVVEAPGPARADGPAGELIGCVAIREIAAAAGGAGVLGAGLAVAGCAAAGASPSETVGLAPAPRPRTELKSLYVAAPARHAGLGAALVHRVEREARRRGAASVELWTDTRFTDAHRLYERLGYVATGGLRELRDLSGTVELGYALDPLPAL